MNSNLRLIPQNIFYHGIKWANAPEDMMEVTVKDGLEAIELKDFCKFSSTKVTITNIIITIRGDALLLDHYCGRAL